MCKRRRITFETRAASIILCNIGIDFLSMN